MSSAAPFRTITIVGFGLIGASLAAAVRQRDPSVRVIAADRRQVIGRLQLGVHCDASCDVDELEALAEAYSSSDLTVLAAPIAVIEQHLPSALEHAPLVTDCGSTKRVVVQAASKLQSSAHFVPGHPMAGSSASGFSHANPDLFQGRSWLLCEGAAPENTDKVEAFVGWLGAVPVRISPEQHDAAVALTSHVPQLLASLLVVLCEQERARVAAGPGFGSATRVAGGNPAIWNDIFASNADEIARVARDLSQRLESIARGLEAGNTEAALELLRQAVLAKAGSKLAP